MNTHPSVTHAMDELNRLWDAGKSFGADLSPDGEPAYLIFAGNSTEGTLEVRIGFYDGQDYTRLRGEADAQGNPDGGTVEVRFRMTDVDLRDFSALPEVLTPLLDGIHAVSAFAVDQDYAAYRGRDAEVAS